MTGVNGGREMRDWLLAEGEDVRARGAIPSALAEKYYDAHPGRRPTSAMLPGPDDDLDQYDDMGEMIPDASSGSEGDAEAPKGPVRYVAAPEGPEGDVGRAEPVADAPAAHSRKEWRKQRAARAAPPGRPGRASARVTAGLRTDINAKISFALTIPGQLWKARDPLCGGTFVEQIPETASALADIVCDSPDLVAFFTGPGGAFMKFLAVGAALMPVAEVVAAHHVYHTMEVPQDPQQPGYAAYAA